MKINLHLNKPDWTFKNLPDLYLPDHEICLCYLYAEVSEPIEGNLVTLSSTLVDRNSCNEMQALATFFNESYFPKSIIFKPTHFSWYKMQCYRIAESVFDLQLEKQHKNLKIEKLYLQLEVRKLCKASARQ